MIDLQPGQAVSTKTADYIQAQVKDEDRVIYAVRGIWPLDLFPDELIIRQKTVSVKRNHFLSTYIETILIKDIGETIVVDAFMAASLTINTRMANNSLNIDSLPRKKALEAKTIIDGLFMRKQ
ncbi:MAG: hypothetical protein Q8P26_01965 [Candidatus Levybacteria bacterium]|nr:hypothetical protein [Candidatus Levybacteria bacterium]